MTTFTQCPFCGANMADNTHIVGISCPPAKLGATDGGARELEQAAQDALRLLETMDNEMYLPFRAEVKKTCEALRLAVDRRKR
jgi:hypothetical protein